MFGGTFSGSTSANPTGVVGPIWLLGRCATTELLLGGGGGGPLVPPGEDIAGPFIEDADLRLGVPERSLGGWGTGAECDD